MVPSCVKSGTRNVLDRKARNMCVRLMGFRQRWPFFLYINVRLMQLPLGCLTDKISCYFIPRGLHIFPQRFFLHISLFYCLSTFSFSFLCFHFSPCSQTASPSLPHSQRIILSSPYPASLTFFLPSFLPHSCVFHHSSFVSAQLHWSAVR